MHKKRTVVRAFNGHGPTEETLRQYGLRVEDYDRIYLQQGGACGICGNDGARLQVDHDHQTGEVRGLLCSYCNSLLAFCQDDIRILHHAIAYLRRSGK